MKETKKFETVMKVFENYKELTTEQRHEMRTNAPEYTVLFDAMDQLIKNKTVPVPIVDIEMMSPERERQLVEENAVSNYIRIEGHEPESISYAVEWQTKRIYERCKNDPDFKDTVEIKTVYR